MNKVLKLKKCNQKYLGKRVKTLANIKEWLHERNEKWWKEERTDLDLKYYVPTDILCEALADYEIGIPKHIQAYINKQNYGKYWQDYDIYNYMEMLCKKGKAEYIGADNSYNHSGNVQNDFNWHTFKMLDKEDRYIVLLAFHIGGDIRGNYTDYIVLEFDYEVGFEELLLCDLSHEYNLTFDLKIYNKIYAITPLALDEHLEVYDYGADEDICGIYGNDDESVKSSIIEKVMREYMSKNNIINRKDYIDFLNIISYHSIKETKQNYKYWVELLNKTNIYLIELKDDDITKEDKETYKEYVKFLLVRIKNELEIAESRGGI